MPPSEEARGVDIGVSLILVIRHFDVVPHTVINSPRRHLLALSPSLSVGCPRNNSTLNGMISGNNLPKECVCVSGPWLTFGALIILTYLGSNLEQRKTLSELPQLIKY